MCISDELHSHAHAAPAWCSSVEEAWLVSSSAFSHCPFSRNDCGRLSRTALSGSDHIPSPVRGGGTALYCRKNAECLSVLSAGPSLIHSHTTNAQTAASQRCIRGARMTCGLCTVHAACAQCLETGPRWTRRRPRATSSTARPMRADLRRGPALRHTEAPHTAPSLLSP